MELGTFSIRTLVHAGTLTQTTASTTTQEIKETTMIEQDDTNLKMVIADRDRFRDDWKAMIKQIEDLEHEVKRLKRMIPNG